MPAYRFAGLILASDFPFPELPPASAVRAAVNVTLGERSALDARRRWLHRWRLPGGRAWMRLARTGRTVVIQFPRLGEFEIRGGSIVCRPRAGIPMRTIRHLLLDQVLPAALVSRRRLVLHASAVEIGGRAVGFLGPAGAGKSTIAAALVCRGASTLTDDALVIDLVRRMTIAVPTYPGLRLWPGGRAVVRRWPAVTRARVAHYTRKERWAGRGVPFTPTPVPLDALYLVSRGARLQVRPLSGRRSIMAIVRYSMMLDATNASAVRHGLENAAAIVSRVPISRLIVPRGARALDAVCRLMVDRSARR